MNISSIPKAVFWLAILGGLALVATAVIGNVAGKAKQAI